MGQEFINVVSLARIDAKQVGDQILGRVRNVVPPGTQESVVASCNLFGQDADTFVVEGWKAWLMLDGILETETSTYEGNHKARCKGHSRGPTCRHYLST